ncbi:MAG TPA: alpha/beta fold hydrolase [Anaerolineales bacterium]|nr:alpha/beta fold hydrolase [Anaerolineales bacterium]
MVEQTLSYRVDGEGSPLVLVHGFGISFNIWQDLAPLLRPHFRLVSLELPGIGVSPAPGAAQDYMQAAVDGIDAVRRALGIEQWSVLGYSSGSRIAEAYARQYPDNVRCAYFLCPLRISDHKARALRFGLRLDRSAPGLGDWLLSGGRLRFLISLLGFNLRAHPREAEWYRDISAVPTEMLRLTLRAIAPVAMQLFSVPVPYTLIWADHDLVVDRPRAQESHDRLIHGRHAAPLESADEIAAILIEETGKRGGRELSDERDRAVL